MNKSLRHQNDLRVPYTEGMSLKDIFTLLLTVTAIVGYEFHNKTILNEEAYCQFHFTSLISIFSTVHDASQVKNE